MIKGITTAGFLPNHLVAERGNMVEIPLCPTIGEGISRLMSNGGTNPNMNYIINWSFSGTSGDFTVRGKIVRLVPEP